MLDDNSSGIVKTWLECEKIVKGKKARYKSFKNEDEARDWLESGANYEKKQDEKDELIKKLDKNAIYFDAGTGRGAGVEVRLTDFSGNSLLYDILDNKKINEFGNYFVSKNRTNNFGELVGLFAAIKYALKYNIKLICGDSSLVIDYWSKGNFNSKNLEQDTINLIKRVTNMRKQFERENGKIEKISGDVNPADLGFHK